MTDRILAHNGELQSSRDLLTVNKLVSQRELRTASNGANSVDLQAPVVNSAFNERSAQVTDSVENNSSREINDTVRSLNWKPQSFNESQSLELVNLTAQDITVKQSPHQSAVESRASQYPLHRDLLLDINETYQSDSGELLVKDWHSSLKNRALAQFFETQNSQEHFTRDQKDQKERSNPSATDSEFDQVVIIGHADENRSARFPPNERLIWSDNHGLPGNRDDKSPHGKQAKNARSSLQVQSSPIGTLKLNRDDDDDDDGRKTQVYHAGGNRDEKKIFSGKILSRKGELTQVSNVVSMKLNISSALGSEKQSCEVDADTYSIRIL